MNTGAGTWDRRALSWHLSLSDQTKKTLLDFCLANTKGYAVTTNVQEVPEFFETYARKVIEALKIPVYEWLWWVSTLGGSQQNGYGVRDLKFTDGYMPNFPHCHGWDGLTVSLHLQAPEAGGDLIEFGEDQWTAVQRIKPEVGLVTVVPDHVWHGVTTVGGDIPRVSIMAGARSYPLEEGYCHCETKPESERRPKP